MTEYFRRKRRQLRAHLSQNQRDVWELLEKRKERALTRDEIKHLFGWINGRGQHVLNTGEKCKGCATCGK